MSREENSTKPLKCLTIKAPWAGLIMWGKKDIENRGWHCYHRGRIAIHASQKFDRAEHLHAQRLYEKILGRPVDPVEWDKICCSGAILGTVSMVDCRTSDPSPWFFGPYGFVLKDPRPLAKPIPKLGKLGLWDLDEETERLVVEAGG